MSRLPWPCKAIAPAGQSSWAAPVPERLKRHASSFSLYDLSVHRITPPDAGYWAELLLKTRLGPLAPGETWLDALSAPLAGTILMTFNSRQFGEVRVRRIVNHDDNRTYWCARAGRPRH